jgi:hypothetical protein
MGKQYPRPFMYLMPPEWQAYWRKTPALRQAWKDEVASLRMHDKRGTNRRTFIRGWVCAMRAHRAALEASETRLQERIRQVVEEEVARAKQEWEKATNIHMLD